MSHPLVSVIIPTYNRPELLARCLCSLADQERPPDTEVLVIDDGSDPPIVEALLRALDGRLRVIRQVHAGAGTARAKGVANARGSLVAFVDDDCTVPRDYLSSVAEAFADDAIEVVQVALENPEPSNLYGRAWERVWKAALAESLEPEACGRRAIRMLGGVMVARRRLFQRIAYEITLEAKEDLDLRLQIEALGIPIVYAPRIVVFNHCRRSLAAYLQQHAWYGRSEFKLRRKWGTLPVEQQIPGRYPGALRPLVKDEGLLDGLKLYGVFWLKRQAGTVGRLQQQAMERTRSNGWRYRLAVIRALIAHYGRKSIRKNDSGNRPSVSETRRAAGTGTFPG